MQLLKINTNFSKNALMEQDFTNIIYNLWTSSDWENADYIWRIILLWSNITKDWMIDNNLLVDFLEFLKGSELNDYLNANKDYNNKYIIAYVKSLSINAYLSHMIDYTQSQLSEVLWIVHEDWNPIKINWHEILFLDYDWRKIICNVIGRFISSNSGSIENNEARLLVDTNIWLQLLLDNKNNIILKWKKLSWFWSEFYLVKNSDWSFVFDCFGNAKFWWIQYKESIKCNWNHYLFDYCKQNTAIFWLVNEDWKDVFWGKVRKTIKGSFVHNWKVMLHWITVDWTNLVLPE